MLTSTISSIELNVGILAGCLPVLLPLVHRVGKIEGLKNYLLSLASDSNILRKKLSRGRIHSASKSEPRDSGSSTGTKTPSRGRPSNEEKVIPSTMGDGPWFMQEQTKMDTQRALNEGY